MNYDAMIENKKNKFYAFKNGIYVPDYSDPHTGTFIYGVRTFKSIDFDFDFGTTKTDKLQDVLPVEYLNGNLSSWECLRNDIHIMLTPSFGCNGVNIDGKADNWSLFYKLSTICDFILKERKSKYCENTLKLNRKISCWDWTTEELIHVWRNLLTPRYLNIINSDYTFQEYVPYRDSYFCFEDDKLHKGELVNWEDLKHENN